VIIVLIGPPGSGKGTQGQFLSEQLKLPHVSIGEVFRKKSSVNDDEGRELNEYMKDGKLAPSELVNKIVSKLLLEPKYNDGCILDGYPRTIEQAEFLHEFTEHKIQVVYLAVDDQTAVSRILNRFSCAACNAIYSNLQDDNNICKHCGSINLVSRNDDNEETAYKRIEEYKTRTEPLIEYYGKQNNIIHVDASKDVQEVSDQLLSLLKKV
jgi:adenylate kinase